MEQVTLNFNAVGKVKRQILNGREHIVAPLTLVVPGVLNGSQGSLFYPPEELEREPSKWNHTPIVIYHPQANGQFVSARDPDVLNSQAVGLVLRTQFKDKLTAEGWFDVERLRQVDDRVLTALEQGKPIELSTGLFTDNERAEEGAVFNGKQYEFIARNYRPDHLAILPDQIGACSNADGCGVLVNEKTKSNLIQRFAEWLNHPTSSEEESDMSKKELVDGLIANCECWTEDDREVLSNMSEDKLNRLADHTKKVKAQEATVNSLQEEKKQWETKASKVEQPKTEETPAPVTANAEEKKPQTADEWFNSAPPEIQSAVRNAMAIEQTEKQELVTKLTANVADEEKETVANTLKTKSVDELRTLVKLIPAKTEEQKPTANYFGMSTPSSPKPEEVKRDDFLPLPTINWAETANA